MDKCRTHLATRLKYVLRPPGEFKIAPDENYIGPAAGREKT